MEGTILPRIAIASLGIAATLIFGGLGIHQRQAVLSQPFLNGQTLADTTDRYHVWPWPLKLAMAIDLPALVGGALVGGAFLSFPKTASILEFVSGLFFSVLLWLTIGSRLSNRPHRDVIIGLSLFYGMALLGAIAPLGYTGFLPVGIVTWVLFAFWLRSGRAHASSANETPFGQA